MVIYLGSDHRGFKIKETVKDYLKSVGYEVIDVGAAEYEQDDDYPDFASLVAQKISLDPATSKGIAMCASGVGVDIVANKFKNVRSVLAINAEHAAASRNDDDTNVLAIATEYLEENEIKKIITSWLQTPFSEDARHMRRLQKIQKIESER